MILKRMDARVATTDPRLAAGRQAEEQMAHYLERAFGNSNEVFVINDLRLEQAPASGATPDAPLGGDAERSDAAQIDHLVFHRWGFVIVESKSVTGRVKINRQGEWTRISGYSRSGEQRGMPSPVLQAQRQARFLTLLMNENADKMLGKLLGIRQCYFGAVPFDTLVAISDQAVIDRDKGANLEGVYKADQIPDAVRELLARRRRAASIFNLKDGGVTLSPADLERVRDFLLASHRPLGYQVASAGRPGAPRPAAVPTATVSEVPLPPLIPLVTPASAATAVTPTAAAAKPDTPAPPFRCRHCKAGSESLSVLYGRYGYYFKCGACAGNTAIAAVCPACEGKARLRKDGPSFYAECDACHTSSLFFTNRISTR